MVALLAEGVDRNSCCTLFRGSLGVSPSSRRAWIEIACPPTFSRPLDVALLAEGVDRNCLSADVQQAVGRRPPRGGRG